MSTKKVLVQGGSYLMEHFDWMLKAFHISIVILGIVVCRPILSCLLSKFTFAFRAGHNYLAFTPWYP